MMRLGLIQTCRTEARDAVEPVLRDFSTHVDLRVIESDPAAPLRTLMRLLVARPHIVVADAGSRPQLAARLYRLLCPKSRLVLCAVGHAPHPVQRRRIDAVVTDLADMRRVIERLWAQIERPSSAIADLDLFRLCPPVRGPEVAHRLLYVGDLSPTSSAPDVLIALAGWAETHPHERAEIWWAADGDLSGILAAQPLPPNLAQQFQGTVTRQELPELMARCGILVASGHTATEDAPVVEAWAAGLIVLASRRMVPARFRLQGDGPAWLFDPARPNGLAEALEQVLACDPARLDELREQGQRLVSDRVVYEVDSSDVADVLSHRPMASSGALTS